MKRHPLSVVWGDMPPEQFAALVEDVRAHGVNEPITIYDEMILDGWHRYRVAGKAEKTCKFVPLPEDEDPAGFVIRANAHRRHLTASQRTAAIVACREWMQRGHDRRTASLNHPNLFEDADKTPRNGGGVKPEATSYLSGTTESEMATEAGVSTRTIRHAKEAERAGLGGHVRSGEISAQAGAEIAKAGLAERVKSGEMSAKDAARKARGEDSEPKPAKPTPAAAAKLRKENELLEAELTEAKLELNELRTKNDELEERIAFIQAESAPVAAVREEKFNNYRAHIRTLKGSVGQWQTKFQESNAENRFLRKRLRALGENIRP